MTIDQRDSIEPDQPQLQSVLVNMYQANDAVVVVAAMPGVRAENVIVSIEGSALTLWASLRSSATKDYLLHEWDYGDYERVVELPVSCTGELTATLGQGQLAVRIAKIGSRGVDSVQPIDAGSSEAGNTGSGVVEPELGGEG